MCENHDRMTQMIDIANDMLDRAYVPYSHFPVGAALLGEDGEIYTGCNVENASLGLTNCAERTALFKAVSEGVHDFEGIVITSRGKRAVSPCGACRQVISEFCSPDMPVWLTNEAGELKKMTVGTLLPYYFEAEDMNTND